MRKATPNLDRFAVEIHKRLCTAESSEDPLQLIRNVATDVGKEWRDRDSVALDNVIDEIRQERQSRTKND